MSRFLAAFAVVAAVVLLVGATNTALAEKRADLPTIQETADGKVVADGVVFDSWLDYLTSDFFQERGLRCGTAFPAAGLPARGSASDCAYSNTNPAAEYDPSEVKYRIPVVVHVIQNNGTAGVSGTGYLSIAKVQSQIDILNEDFLALQGTNGQNGTDVQIEFYLATEDPGGSPTTGITYSVNSTWFNDSGAYYNTLAWNPNNYLNIYTNKASGALGYVPFLPQNGSVGANSDRVVCYYRAFGRNSGFFPYHQGRTATHEVGHYLGLFHTFQSGCAGGSCYTGGDRICDTNNEQSFYFGCPSSASSCSSTDPYHNYMDYTDDLCMTNFTPEQAKRNRCTLEFWRPNLYEIVEVLSANYYPDFDMCFSGPGERPAPVLPITVGDCLDTFDTDTDTDIDMIDLGDFTENYIGG